MAAQSPRPEVPEELPVLPLREFVVFPYMVLPLLVARDRSMAAVDDALAGNRMVLLVAQRDPVIQNPEPDDLHSTGTVAMVMRSTRTDDGRMKVLMQGLGKARIESHIDQSDLDGGARRVRVSPLRPDAEEEWCVEAEALVRAVKGRVEELLPLKNLPPEVISVTTNVDHPGRLADLVASNLRLRLGEAQEVLETQDSLARLRRVDSLLRRQLEVRPMQAEIQRQRD